MGVGVPGRAWEERWGQWWVLAGDQREVWRSLQHPPASLQLTPLAWPCLLHDVILRGAGWVIWRANRVDYTRARGPSAPQLRVRVGLHSGVEPADVVLNPTSGRMHYTGASMATVKAVSDTGCVSVRTAAKWF